MSLLSDYVAQACVSEITDRVRRGQFKASDMEAQIKVIKRDLILDIGKRVQDDMDGPLRAELLRLHDASVLLQAQRVGALAKLESLLKSGPTVWSQICTFFTELQLLNELVYNRREGDLETVITALLDTGRDAESVIESVSKWMTTTSTEQVGRLQTFLISSLFQSPGL